MLGYSSRIWEMGSWEGIDKRIALRFGVEEVYGLKN
jgi:hypothetical protein